MYCYDCYGTGYIDDGSCGDPDCCDKYDCPECDGTGEVDEEE